MEIANWHSIECLICGEPLGKHTLFGRLLAGDGEHVSKVWHNACGVDARPSDGEQNAAR